MTSLDGRRGPNAAWDKLCTNASSLYHMRDTPQKPCLYDAELPLRTQATDRYGDFFIPTDYNNEFLVSREFVGKTIDPHNSHHGTPSQQMRMAPENPHVDDPMPAAGGDAGQNVVDEDMSYVPFEPVGPLENLPM